MNIKVITILNLPPLRLNLDRGKQQLFLAQDDFEGDCPVVISIDLSQVDVLVEALRQAVRSAGETTSQPPTL